MRILQSILDFFRPTTVAGIVAEFEKTVSRLEAHSEYNDALCNAIDSEISALRGRLRVAANESARASDVAKNIRKLISAS